MGSDFLLAVVVVVLRCTKIPKQSVLFPRFWRKTDEGRMKWA